MPYLLFGSDDNGSDGDDDIPELSDLSDLLPGSSAPGPNKRTDSSLPVAPKVKKVKDTNDPKKPKAQKKSVSDVLEKWATGKRTSKVDLKRISKGWETENADETEVYKKMLGYMEAFRLLLAVPQFGIVRDVFDQHYVDKIIVDEIFQNTANTFSENPRAFINSHIRTIEEKGELSIDDAVVNTAVTFFNGLRYKTVLHRGKSIPIMHALLQSNPCTNCECLRLCCAACLFSSEIKDEEDFDLVITRRFISSLPFAPSTMHIVRNKILALL